MGSQILFFPRVSFSNHILDRWKSVLKYRKSIIFIFLFLREEGGDAFYFAENEQGELCKGRLDRTRLVLKENIFSA